MSDPLEWLPGLIRLSDSGGDWNHYLDRLYEAFCEDFVRSKPTYPPKRFALKRHPMARGKEATFWHLIQEGAIEEEREPDLRRCERIRWPRRIIEAVQTDQVKVWRNVRGRNDRIVISVNDFSYVVILDDRDDYVLLWTAYTVEADHRRRKLEAEYNSWTASTGK